MTPNPSHGTTSFALPPDLIQYLSKLDNFIATKIAPLQASNDNERFFDHRREHARTDWENQGLPRDDWEDLLAEAQQKQEFIGGRLSSTRSFTFGLTEPDHGSDATHMSTRAEKSKKNGIDGWVVNGAKMWISGMHRATHCLAFARTHGKAGDAIGITAFFVLRETPGFKIESYEWTFNMPTDHASLTFTDVFVPDSAVLGVAASSLGAAEYCVEESVGIGEIGCARRLPIVLSKSMVELAIRGISNSSISRYRHHRRYRITEGSEEIQMRKVAAYLFGYVGPKKAELLML
ncbi:2-methylacyl-CoA dehydrogenase, mitochondrial [Lachnellula willkommii]|uniref:2-methylacyl-CoA dehydrogenase, mitochondrial n=1 Tax=Lachnellula willkommii TaxID=215461 RepID=A0A559MHC3_9HELO|nr:2-methylacyl-CoA dehydrogenase, mitochondrial [Lachnellula willkommii]